MACRCMHINNVHNYRYVYKVYYLTYNLRYLCLRFHCSWLLLRGANVFWITNEISIWLEKIVPCKYSIWTILIQILGGLRCPYNQTMTKQSTLNGTPFVILNNKCPIWLFMSWNQSKQNLVNVEHTSNGIQANVHGTRCRDAWSATDSWRKN